MNRIAFFIYFIRLLSFCLSSPVSLDEASPSHSLLSKRVDWKWKLEDLNNEFKGILWDHVFNDKNDCTPEQLDKIIFTTRAAMWMLELPGTDGQYPYSSAWNRYFGDYQVWIKNGMSALKFSSMIQYNIIQASKFPRNGHEKNRSTGKRVHSTCNYTPHSDGKQRCENGKIAAITTHPSGSLFGTWTIAFCPLFFQAPRLRYLEERTKGNRKPYAYISDLDTYERALVHEYMHVGIFGYRNKIVDVKASLYHGGEILDIYGESRCRDFARKELSSGKPNTEVLFNADTYSWFFTYYWFDKKWGWSQSPHDELRKGDLHDADETGSQFPDIEIPVPSFPVLEENIVLPEGMPETCQLLEDVPDSHGNPTIICQFIGMEYDEWVAGLNDTFPSRGGCELSEECHKPFRGIAVDPGCTCTCDSKQTPLSDDRCDGFAGSLPERISPSDHALFMID